MKDPVLWELAMSAAINQMDDDKVRSDLFHCLQALNCVATGKDGDDEMDAEQMKEKTRAFLLFLGYNINE